MATWLWTPPYRMFPKPFINKATRMISVLSASHVNQPKLWLYYLKLWLCKVHSGQNTYMYVRDNFFTRVLTYLFPGVCINSLEHLKVFCWIRFSLLKVKVSKIKLQNLLQNCYTKNLTIICIIYSSVVVSIPTCHAQGPAFKSMEEQLFFSFFSFFKSLKLNFWIFYF